jgi:amino acid transporter
MHDGGSSTNRSKPAALSLLSSERPRNVGWVQAAGLLFGDWGTSRLYVLGLAFLFAGRTSFYLVCLMSLLILAVGWAYSQICRIYPDGGGVYTAARNKSRTLAVIGALLLFADYTVTASLSVLDGFHYFGLPLQRHAQVSEAKRAAESGKQSHVQDAGDSIQISHDAGNTADLAELPPGIVFPKEVSHRVHYDADEHQLVFEGQMSEADRAALLSLSTDPGYHSAVQKLFDKSQPEGLLAWDSPGLWAIIAIAGIGLFNLLGPTHSSAFAIFAAIGMVGITLLITAAALFSGKVHWGEIQLGSLAHSPGQMWVAFVSIVLALSGVEAIANLTGVMQKPVAHTARKAIAVVALEVAIFNIVLALFMLAIYPLDRNAHVNDMLAFLSSNYLGGWGEWPVRIVGGLLLLSAGNTAVNGLMSILYIVSRDGEIPAVFQKINRFGAPWVAGIVATAVPILVLLISHDLESLAALYAIGVIGAVAINVTLCAGHPRLRRMHRKVPMLALGIVLILIWITLACTKLHALAFVSIVLAIGLTARALTKWAAKRKGVKPSLLRQAIHEQLTAETLMKPKVLLGTYGSDALASAALSHAKAGNYSLVICFIRQIALNYRYDNATRRLNIDTDLAAVRLFTRVLDLAHAMGVSVIPVYDVGHDAAELLAETAAMLGCERVLIGTSRQGALYHLIKGSFQQRLESILPPEIPVEVIQSAPHQAVAPTKPEFAPEAPTPVDPSVSDATDTGKHLRSTSSVTANI